MKIRKIAAVVIALVTALLCCAQALGEISGPLQQGDTGAAVAALQERLIALGYLEKEADGVYDEETGDYYLVMELVEGEEVSRLLKRDGRLTVAQAAPLLEQAASALD